MFITHLLLEAKTTSAADHNLFNLSTWWKISCQALLGHKYCLPEDREKRKIEQENGPRASREQEELRRNGNSTLQYLRVLCAFLHKLLDCIIGLSVLPPHAHHDNHYVLYNWAVLIQWWRAMYVRMSSWEFLRVDNITSSGRWRCVIITSCVDSLSLSLSLSLICIRI
jgi:hypothetical protein